MTQDTKTASSLREYGIALLRISLGIVFIAHSALLKVFIFGMPGTVSFFESLGLAGWFAYVVVAVETVGGVCLVLGVYARWAAVCLLPIALGATWAHWGSGWLFESAGGGWEYPAYLAILCVAQILLGEGAFALQRSNPIKTLLSRSDPASI